MASSQEIDLDANPRAARATLAKALAPEEIRLGDYVTPLHQVWEAPSFWWRCEGWDLPPDQPVRIRFLMNCDGAPLRVKSICLPFVLAKHPNGQPVTLDLRRCQVARLDVAFAKQSWKRIKKSQAAKSASSAAESTT